MLVLTEGADKIEVLVIILYCFDVNEYWEDVVGLAFAENDALFIHELHLLGVDVPFQVLVVMPCILLTHKYLYVPVDKLTLCIPKDTRTRLIH